ncbi:MAG TPA: helix-turn-helix transcriptional regulator [Allosphingosinicella sp.]|nr:helix-turn-helix transcriptional regulator [Allosphingosinicella sp.]
MARSTHTEPYKILLGVLIDARKRAGVTQTELARRLKRPQPYMSMVERGERRIDVIQFYAIMKALGADPEEVFRELIAKLPDEVDV